MDKWAFFGLFFYILLLSGGVSIHYALAAFTEPTVAPPDGNAPVFLNIGEDNQAKKGSLRLGTGDVSSPYNYQLEVLGEGAVMTKVISDNLKISETKNVLYVDSANDRVCVGPCLGLAGSKLEVSDGGMNANAQNNNGISAVSSAQSAVYGSGATYGVQGVASGAANSGVYAANVTGTAVEGSATASNAFDQVWCYYSGASTEYYDCTAGARSASVGDIYNANGYLLRQAANAGTVYFGSINRFNGLGIQMHVTSVTGAVAWEYYNGTAWVAFTPSSGAYNFLSADSNPAKITLWPSWSNIPANWAQTSINGSNNYYYIRARTTTSYSSPFPVGTQFTIIRSSNVYGLSASGYGIYGTANNLDGLGLWAGYFDGPVGTNDDVSGAKHLATKPKISLIPFTFGQVLADYNFANTKIKAFDGSYLWGIDGDSVYKIRASDGFQIFKNTVGSTPTDVLYDGNYIWVTVGLGTDHKIIKIDPATGQTVCDNNAPLGGNPSYTVDNPRSMVFDGQYYWVLDKTGDDTGRLVKVNNLCARVNTLTLADASSGQQIDFTEGKVIYNGAFLWVIGTEENFGNGMALNVNPSSSKVVVWTGLVGENPQDIFYDNYNYWVTSKGDNTVARFYLGAKVCTAGNTGQSCAIDSDCDTSSGNGACFAKPTAYGSYTVQNGTEPTRLAFDGTYLWLTAKNYTNNKYGLFRLLAADPEQQTAYTGVEQDNPLLSLLFDGTHVWAGTSGSTIKKIYSGTGWGLTDLSRIVALQFNAPLVQQSGSININGSARIGGSYTASGDLVASGNLWPEAAAQDTIGDGTTPVGAGTYSCPDGHFVNNVKTNAGSEVVQIECRGL